MSKRQTTQTSAYYENYVSVENKENNYIPASSLGFSKSYSLSDLTQDMTLSLGSVKHYQSDPHLKDFSKVDHEEWDRFKVFSGHIENTVDLQMSRDQG